MKWYDKQKQLYAAKNESERQEPEPVRYDNYKETPVDTYQKPQEDPRLDEAVDAAMNAYSENNFDNSYVETPAPKAAMMVQVDDNATTISRGTLINGNIETEGDLIIHGHVKGDIICNSTLTIFGVVEGTLNCMNAYFDHATIIGDIGCSGNLELSESSVVHGDVEAYQMLNGGRIKGNANIAEGVKFSATSAIVGNVSANDIEIERGAVIQGEIDIRQEVYFE